MYSIFQFILFRLYNKKIIIRFILYKDTNVTITRRPIRV